MASLLDMAQARLQGLLDLPARAGRALVDPTVFSGLLGAPTLPKERGIAQAAYGLPPEQNMSVLNPEQAAYMQGYAQGEPLSYLGLLAPFTAPAAVAGAKAVAPQAGMALENYMARQGLIQPLTAYHGTPHTIQGKFDINKIGSGEGAQVYGHGMYFAENPKVAESYAGLSPASGSQPSPRRMIGGVEVDPMTPQYKAAQLVEEMGVSKAKKFVNDWAKDPMPDQIEFVKGIQDSLVGITKKSDVKNLGTGNLYKVDIPDDYIPTMMDWDKPLGEQSSTVKKAINSIKNKITPEMRDELGGDLNLLFGKDVTPNQFLNTLEIIHPESITGIGERWLNEAGVKGIRYLDNASRASGKGTSNFVVFDPTDVKILEKNSKKVEGLLD
jgi:hypothetical protein